MPLLGFGKEGLDPDLAFAHRFLVGLGQVVAAHFVEVGLIEGAVDNAAMVAARALGLDGTGIAEHRVGPIDDFFLGVLGLAAWQPLPLWAVIGISCRVVGELALAVERRPMVKIGQRDVGLDTSVLK